MGTIHRCLGVVAAIATSVMLITSPASAQKRVALVVGNSAYKHVTRLENPANDARLMADTLRSLGFTLVGGRAQLDLDKAGFESVVQNFGNALPGADVALFYYAGHGLQVRGSNFLVPVGANPVKEADVDFQMLDTNLVLRQMESAGARLNLVILDACRNNPFGGRGLRSTGAGLAQMQAPQGTLISFATQPGNVALDGTGRNSPYTAALAQAIKKPGLDIFRTFNEVGLAVASATSGAQQPWVSLSPIKGDFYFGGAPAPVAAPVAPQPDPAERAWLATHNTTSIAVLDDFIRHFGSTVYGSMARARLEELKKSQTAVVVPAPTPVPPQARPQPAAVAPPVAPAVPPQTAPKPTVAPAAAPAVGVFNTPSPGGTPLSVERERALKPKDTFRECEQCPEMLVVPAGSFMMGSPAGERDRHPREGPPHRVTLAKPFAVGKFSITFAEWDACVADRGCNGYRPDDKGWGRGNMPAIFINWDDAKAYVAWLSQKTGKTYRLLSEAESEYVTRAGTTTPYWIGKTLSTAQANFKGNRDGDYRQKTVPVDSFAPNPFGLYQVHGNVNEWLEDCYNDSYKDAPTDGSAWMSGNCQRRMMRGGVWYLLDGNARSAFRDAGGRDFRDHGMGFRVARSLTQ